MLTKHHLPKTDLRSELSSPRRSVEEFLNERLKIKTKPSRYRVNVQSWPNVLRALHKMSTGDAFKVESRYSIFSPPPLPPSPPKSNDWGGGQLISFWMKQNQLCVVVGEGLVERKTIPWKNCKVSQDF